MQAVLTGQQKARLAGEREPGRVLGCRIGLPRVAELQQRVEECGAAAKRHIPAVAVGRRFGFHGPIVLVAPARINRRGRFDLGRGVRGGAVGDDVAVAGPNKPFAVDRSAVGAGVAGDDGGALGDVGGFGHGYGFQVERL